MRNGSAYLMSIHTPGVATVIAGSVTNITVGMATIDITDLFTFVADRVAIGAVGVGNGSLCAAEIAILIAIVGIAMGSSSYRAAAVIAGGVAAIGIAMIGCFLHSHATLRAYHIFSTGRLHLGRQSIGVDSEADNIFSTKSGRILAIGDINIITIYRRNGDELPGRFAGFLHQSRAVLLDLQLVINGFGRGIIVDRNRSISQNLHFESGGRIVGFIGRAINPVIIAERIAHGIGGEYLYASYLMAFGGAGIIADITLLVAGIVILMLAGAFGSCFGPDIQAKRTQGKNTNH